MRLFPLAFLLTTILDGGHSSVCRPPSQLVQFRMLTSNQCPRSSDGNKCSIGWPIDTKISTKRFTCSKIVLPTSTVRVLNSSGFLDLLKLNVSPSVCWLSNFYSPYCPFCSRLAPSFNALPRLFPNLFLVAVDASDYSKLTSRYGVIGTPTVMLWQSGRAVARFDTSDYSLQGLAAFLHRWTDLEPIGPLHVTVSDHLGPLPSTPLVHFDMYLLFSWLFLLIVTIFFLARTTTAVSLWDLIRANFREANE